MRYKTYASYVVPRELPNPKDNLVPYTWCVIEEVDFENWGIGGNAVTPEMLKAILGG